MSLSRDRCTERVDTSASLIDDNSRDSLAAAAGTSLPARRGFPGAIGVHGRAVAKPQVVEILVDRGYRPSQSVAFAHEPLRLAFRRLDADHCTERVVFSAPRIERRLSARGTTLIDLPAQPPGTVRFTCGMGRYRGEIELVERGGTSLGRSGSFRLLSAALGTLVVFTALGTLPLYAAAALGVSIGGLSAVLGLVPRLIEIARSKHS
jgi:Cupredoxin-like domain